MDLLRELTERKKRTIVLVEEEIGYRYHFWFTDMSGRQLEDWWKEQECAFLIFPVPIPEDSKKELEKVVQKEEEGFVVAGMMLFASDVLPGEVITAKSKAEYQAYFVARSEGKYYELLLHMDNDSVLIRPDSSYIFHKGCDENNIYLPDKQTG